MEELLQISSATSSRKNPQFATIWRSCYDDAMQIDPEKTWVTSDNHFGHHNIIRFCSRPADHEAIMVKHWNEAVPANGMVLHLGDLAYRDCKHFEANIARFLNGTKKLILGNHDKQKPEFYKRCGFEPIPAVSLEFEHEGQVAIVTFDHYPLPELVSTDRRKLLHVHGHIHNNGYSKDSYVPFRANQINVSVEQTQYRPVLIGDLLRGALS